MQKEFIESLKGGIRRDQGARGDMYELGRQEQASNGPQDTEEAAGGGFADG